MPTLKPPDVSSVTLRPPRKLSAGDLGGFLAGLLLYALALNYLQNGPDGVKGWLSAKFINQPVDLGATGTTSSSSSSRSGGAGLTSTKARQPAAI